MLSEAKSRRSPPPVDPIPSTSASASASASKSSDPVVRATVGTGVRVMGSMFSICSRPLPLPLVLPVPAWVGRPRAASVRPLMALLAAACPASAAPPTVRRLGVPRLEPLIVASSS